MKQPDLKETIDAIAKVGIPGVIALWLVYKLGNSLDTITVRLGEIHNALIQLLAIH